MSWKKMTDVKKRRGLGIIDIEFYNSAFLAKKIWRIMTHPNLLMSQILKAKYFRKVNILEANCSGQSSWFWKSLLSARDLVKHGLRMRVGDGRNLNIWNDKWVPRDQGGMVKTRRPENCELERVSDLVKERKWDVNFS
ncbi:hypothetical protein ACH5RR_036941 [Cinchona calisaya]|uniref:Uncharacterized protein n=1 Tax=Cinchona calisaya TaxID=153742 RepID=A0ABD2Y7T0_9GENT